MRLPVLILIMATTASLSHGQSPFLDSIMAATDYRIQGEYSGSYLDGSPCAVQVIALGQENFRAVAFAGGLPGMGWDGKAGIILTGKFQGNTALFSNTSGWSLTVDSLGINLIGLNPSQAKFVLTKTMRQSPTLQAEPPGEAQFLFNGVLDSNWISAKLDDENYLLPQGIGEATGAVTRRTFFDFTMHIEFRIPFLPQATGQNRGNSGIYIQNRYELQILDSFGSFPSDSVEASRQCGAIWEQSRPKVNMCFPPLAWQTYDIDFTAARFGIDGKTIQNRAQVTVRQNGILIQEGWHFPDRTVLGDFEGPKPGPFRLQSHGEAVVYRTIWVIEKATELKTKLSPKFHGKQENTRSLLTQKHAVNGKFIRNKTTTFYPGTLLFPESR
jgi:hypothetical protein